MKPSIQFLETIGSIENEKLICELILAKDPFEVLKEKYTKLRPEKAEAIKHYLPAELDKELKWDPLLNEYMLFLAEAALKRRYKNILN